MTDSNTNELLPCPFCGGEAKVTCFGRGRYQANVECTKCSCRLHERFISKAEAMKAWNRRDHAVEPILEPWDDPTKYDAYCGCCNYPIGDGKLNPWDYCPNCGTKIRKVVNE